MQFSDITTWSVSKGVATPVNPHWPHLPTPGAFTQFAIMNPDWELCNKKAQQHTYATDAPDGSYSADRFGEIVWQYQTFVGGTWINALMNVSLKHYSHFDDYKSFNMERERMIDCRQFLPFIDQAKEAESPKFGEWISVKDKKPKKGSMIFVCYQYDEMAVIFYEGLEAIMFTHWMPLPSPPKTL